MNELTELRKRLLEAKSAYAKADSSLDGGSLAFVLAHEELKDARFCWLAACEDYIVKNVLKENPENVYE